MVKAMSLGFNRNRKTRQTSLPGEINSVPPTRRVVPRTILLTRIADSSAAPVTQNNRSEYRTRQERDGDPVTRNAPVDEATDETRCEAQWVYATDRLGERIMVVYPMKSGEDGVVRMRAKRVHRHTGQLSYEWIDAYDPNTETRYLTDFSLVS